MAPVITHDEVAYLQVLIQEDHHTTFKDLYPDAIVIPKNALHSAHALSHHGVSYRTTCYQK